MDYVPCPTLRLRKRRKENAKRAENPPKVRSKTYDLASQKHTGHVIENGAKHSRARTGLATVTQTFQNLSNDDVHIKILKAVMPKRH